MPENTILNKQEETVFYKLLLETVEQDLTWVFPYCQSVISHQVPATRKLAEAYLQCWYSSASEKKIRFLFFFQTRNLSLAGGLL